MGKITKSVIYPALTITFMLLMADFVSINLITHIDIVLNCECPDFSKHCEQSHTNYFEDEIPNSEAIAKHYKSETLKDFLLLTNPFFTNNFYSEFWQPPENS